MITLNFMECQNNVHCTHETGLPTNLYDTKFKCSCHGCDCARDNCTMSGINVITTFNKINQSTEVLKAGLFWCVFILIG